MSMVKRAGERRSGNMEFQGGNEEQQDQRISRLSVLGKVRLC